MIQAGYLSNSRLWRIEDHQNEIQLEVLLARLINSTYNGYPPQWYPLVPVDVEADGRRTDILNAICFCAILEVHLW